jgi:hypothetical protein
MALTDSDGKKKKKYGNDRASLKAKAERMLVADVKQSDIDTLLNTGGITPDTDISDIKQRLKWQEKELNPTIEDQEIKDILNKKIKEPTGQFKKKKKKKKSLFKKIFG